MSVQSWLQYEEAHGVSQCPAMVITRRLLVDYLQGDMPASEAASSIIESGQEVFKTPGNKKPLEPFWMEFSSLACFVGSEPVLVERMVELVGAISRQPTPSLESDTDPDIWLRGFGYAFREYGIYVDQDQESVTFEEWIKQAGPLANASAFAASLLLREDSNLVPMAHSATWIFRCALEEIFDDDFGSREADVFMPAAAAFVRIAGKRIYELCLKGEQTSASGRAYGPLWHGGRELNVQRWQFWKDRFTEFSSMDGVGEDCRKSAAEACASMAQAEAEAEEQ